MKITRRISHILEIIQNLWIDLSIQGKFWPGRIESIDGGKVISSTESTRYSVIKQIFFQYVRIQKKDVIVDVGCGKGRVFNYLLYKGIKNRMIGYEINPIVGLKTKKNLSKYKNVTIIAEDIFTHFPVDGNIFFFYNSFKGPMLEEFKDRIWEIRNNDPVILYLHPLHIDCFDNNRFIYQMVEIPFLQWSIKLAIVKIAK
jgi:SAM-dependent methyltransferase